jgi:hypothetical protein
MQSVNNLMDFACRKGIAQERSHGHGGALVCVCVIPLEEMKTPRKSGSVAGELFFA